MSQELVPAADARPNLVVGHRPMAIVPTSMDEAYRLGKAIVISGMAPRGMDTPEKCMIAIMRGMEVGLTPMQAVDKIAVVNGRPTIWGDGAMGLVRGSGLCEWVKEVTDGTGDARTAVCTVKRRGESDPISRSFSVADAKRAQLWGKSGPWQQFPDRMMQMRARAFALRDLFADVLGGLYLREEVEDERPRDPARRGPPPAPVDPIRNALPAPAANDTLPETTAAAATASVQDAEFSEPTASNAAPEDLASAQSAAAPNGDAGALLAEIVDAYGTATTLKACDDLDAFYSDDVGVLDPQQREAAQAAAQQARSRVAPQPEPTMAKPADEPQRDPFAIPQGFDEEAGYTAWIGAAIAAVVDEATAKRLHEAWVGSKPLRFETPVSEPVIRDLQAKVTSTLAPFRSKPVVVETAPVDLTKVPGTAAEYEMQFLTRAAAVSSWDEARALKTFYLRDSVELRGSLDPAEASRARMKAALDSKLNEFRPEAA